MTKSDVLFLFVVASLPVQLGKFYFLDHSYVLGLPIDYRALSIYLSDIVILLFLAVSALENRNQLKKIYIRFKAFIVILVAFNLYLFTSSAIFSVDKVASIVANLKILELSFLSIAAASTLTKKSIKSPALFVLKVSLFWQGALTLAQFLLQRSSNLWPLGERSFDVSTPAIAHADFFGLEILRPYGTFPHPNVLAAYLSLGLIILGSQAKRQLVAALALILTFSRSAYLATSVAIFASTRKAQYLILEIFLALFVGLFLLRQLLESQLSSIAERLLLIQSALDISLKNPLFGVGSNNFILELSKLDLTSLAETRLLQPVHNVFLLILAENGIIGLFLFTAVLFVVARSINTQTKLILIIALLIYASVDHFLWTLHQGQMLFFLTLAYIVSKPNFNHA